MAKKITLMMMIMMMAVLSGCGMGGSASSKKEPRTIELTDEDFVKWTNEITVNPDSYMGDTLHFEGLYMKPGHDSIMNKHGYAYRHGLGCCGTDGGVFGYEFDNDEVEVNDGDWIEVTGVISQYTENGNTRIVLKDSTVTVKDEHGTIFVAQ